jgi:hypothetical protein
MVKKGLMRYYTFGSRLFEAGYSKVMWRFNAIFNILLLVNANLILYGWYLKMHEIVFIGIFILIMIFFLGYFYIKFGFFKADQEAIFSHNQRILDIQKELKEIKGLLKDGNKE